MVQLNQRDFVYPEYPVPQSKLVVIEDEDVWKKWKDDNDK